MPRHLFLIDAVMVGLAFATLLAAIWQHRRIVTHWHLLLPGLLSLGASLVLVGYPRWTDVLEMERFSLAMVAFAVGAIRGRTMKLASDRVKKMAALNNTGDAIVAASVQAGFAGLDMVLDIKAGGLTHLTSTIELILIATAAYLLGRSVALWMHARRSADVQLIE